MTDIDSICTLCDQCDADCHCRQDAEAEWNKTRPNLLRSITVLLLGEFGLALVGAAAWFYFHS